MLLERGIFRERYERLTDDELSRIVDVRKDLVPEAASALDREVERRHTEQPENPSWARNSEIASTDLRIGRQPFLWLLQQILRILLSLVVTFVCGFGGIAFYLLSYNHTPLSSAERICAYLLAWPLIVRELLGGVDDFEGRYLPAGKWVVWSAWIGLWVYYYLLLAFWQGKRRKQ